MLCYRMMIDFSSIAGGAPGLTTGLRVSACEPIKYGPTTNGHIPMSGQHLDVKIKELNFHEGNGHLV